MQTDAEGIQNHKFYKSTVNAMDEARAAAAQKSTTNNNAHIQKLDFDAVTPDERVLKGEQETIDNAPKDKAEEMEEISVAGRAKMQVPKQREDQKPAAEPKQPQETDAESKEDTEAKSELNVILKRSPSMLLLLAGESWRVKAECSNFFK